MQKTVHLFFVVFIFLSNVVYGMEIVIASKPSEEKVAWNDMSFHDRVLYRIQDGTFNCQGMFGVTPLFGACQLGYLEAVKLLLEAQADVNVETYAGCTPLHAASQGGYIEAVKLLLAAGADIYWKNCREHTALQLAQEKGHAEIVILLQEQLQRDAFERRNARLAKRKTW